MHTRLHGCAAAKDLPVQSVQNVDESVLSCNILCRFFFFVKSCHFTLVVLLNHQFYKEINSDVMIESKFIVYTLTQE